MTNLCDECETVAHCLKHGCIPKRDFWDGYVPEPTRPAPMTTDKALDLALEALELNNNEWKALADSGDCGYWSAEDQDHYKQTNEAITAIKQARALDKKAENARELGLDYEPEERYTYGTPLLDAFTKPAPVQEPVAFNAGVPPLYPEMKDGETISVEYTTPPAQPAPVQEPDAFDCGVYLGKGKDHAIKHHVSYQPAPVQETKQGEIFCGVDFADGVLSVSVLRRRPDDVAELLHSEQIELQPPAAQRQWVGLTDEDIIEMWPQTSTVGWDDIRLIEAKLKEKNT